MAKPTNKSSKALERLLTEYYEDIQELCRLYDISPNRDESQKRRMKAAVKELSGLCVETEDPSCNLSSLHTAIDSGVKVMRRTIELLENDSDPVQPCLAMDFDPPKALTDTERRRLRPGVIEHNRQITGVLEGLRKQYKTSLIIQDLEQMFYNYIQVYEKMGLYTEDSMIFQQHTAESSSCDPPPSSSDPRPKPPVDALQRRCQTCACVREDSAAWDLIEPSVTSDDGQIKYRMNVGSGCYECSRTGLRITCSGDVNMEYLILDWNCVNDCPEMENFTPCGPLMDITIISGELKEVYLPHFLCLGEAPSSDEVRILHVEDGGISFEKCQLTRFHARLLDLTFSPKGVLLRNGFSVKYHCETLIYKTRKSPLTLHVYLIPSDKTMIEAVQENETDSEVIRKPGPETSFPMKMWFSLRTLEKMKKSECCSEITPEKLQLKYKPLNPNYFEVFIDAPKEDFSIQLMQENNKVWDVKIRQDDFNMNSSVTDGRQMTRSLRDKTVHEILEEHLDDLTEDKLKRFKRYLTQGDENFKKLPKSKVEKADTTDVVTLMIDQYKEDGAAKLTVIILGKIQMNNNVKELQETLDQMNLN